MMTDLTLAKETSLFLLSIVVGVGLSLLYDLLRVLRLQTRHRPIVVSLEDLLYFLVCAAVTFGFALKDNSGQIRGYILIGELLGWGCWHLTAGELAVKIASGIFALLRRVVLAVARVALFPFYCLWKLALKILRLLSRPMKLFLKKVMQTQKYNLKRKQMMLYNLSSRFQKKRQKGEERHGDKRKKHSKNRLLLAAMIVFVAFCSFKIVGTQMEVSEKQYQLQQLEQSIEEQQKLNEELENQLEKGKTDQTEIVGKAAYEQYGYGYPDEHIYIDSQAS